MKGITLENFKNLHYETKLLESLDWDETQLMALFEYVDSVFNDDVIVHPSHILETISSFFGENAKDCFENIFNEIIMTHNLHLAENTDEH